MKKLVSITAIFIMFFVFCMSSVYIVARYMDSSETKKTSNLYNNYKPIFNSKVQWILITYKRDSKLFFKTDNSGKYKVSENLSDEYTLIEAKENSYEEIPLKISNVEEGYVEFSFAEIINPDCIAIYRKDELQKNIEKLSLNRFPSPSDYYMCKNFDFENLFKSE